MKSNELKQHRKELGLTQRELAKELCVTVRAVVSWETNTRKMPKSVEKLFCILYGIEFKNNVVFNDDLTPDLFNMEGSL